MVNREVAGDALWFAEDLITYEDLECHARLARVGPAAYLDCETAYQWSHPGPRITDANVYVRNLPPRRDRAGLRRGPCVPRRARAAPSASSVTSTCWRRAG